MEKLVKEVRDFAYQKIIGLSPDSIDPIEALMGLDWDCSTDLTEVTQKDLAAANHRLDERFCLGRAAKAAAFVENWFPTSELFFAEVRQDALRDFMLKKMRDNPSVSEVEELLMYEEPHGIIVVDNKQFDPLSKNVGRMIRHPNVAPTSVWEGIACEWLCSKVIFNTDLFDKLGTIELALQLSPNSTNALAIRAASYLELGMDFEAMRDLETVIRLRPNARSMFISQLMGSDVAGVMLRNAYPQAVTDYLEAEFQTALQQNTSFVEVQQ